MVSTFYGREDYHTKKRRRKVIFELSEITEYPFNVYVGKKTNKKTLKSTSDETRQLHWFVNLTCVSDSSVFCERHGNLIAAIHEQ